MRIHLAARRVTGRSIEMRVEPPRPGDPSHLVADAAEARGLLGWKPVYSDLDQIIRAAWEWRLAHPRGSTSI